MNNLDFKKLEKQVKIEIDEYCEKKYAEKPRKHLGFSIMGEPCDRKLYLTFRQAKQQKFNGRMRRLFQVGHDAEPRMADYLRGIGFEVWTGTPINLWFHPESDSYFLSDEFETEGLTENVTNNLYHEHVAASRGIKRKQFKTELLNGHYQGSGDAILQRWNMKFLWENKTNGTGAGYNAVEEKGVRRAKEMHWVQMCQYGKGLGIKYYVYTIENKNDSDITVKIGELDWGIADNMERRADKIIYGPLPAKYAESPAHQVCKMCHLVPNCFHGEPISKNCHSCKMSRPIEDKQWYCERWKDVIPQEARDVGCDDWNPVL